MNIDVHSTLTILFVKVATKDEIDLQLRKSVAQGVLIYLDACLHAEVLNEVVMILSVFLLLLIFELLPQDLKEDSVRLIFKQPLKVYSFRLL